MHRSDGHELEIFPGDPCAMQLFHYAGYELVSRPLDDDDDDDDDDDIAGISAPPQP